MKILNILTGPPGCGKSTFAATLTKADNICCADDFHMVNGEYKWSAANQGRAHSECKAKCINLMMQKESTIVIANTNTTWKEMKPYIEMASEQEYSIVFGRPLHNFTVEELRDRNVHSVPEASIAAMKSRLISDEQIKQNMSEQFPKVQYVIKQFENK